MVNSGKCFHICGQLLTHKKYLGRVSKHVTLECKMKFSLKYLDKLDLIVMDELPPNYFKESSHNQISALIGGI